MKAVFRTNLGMIDAKTLGIDYKACRIGEAVDVSTEVMERLRKAGIAISEDEARKDPIIISHREEVARRAEEDANDESVKGQAKKPAITAPAK